MSKTNNNLPAFDNIIKGLQGKGESDLTSIKIKFPEEADIAAKTIPTKILPRKRSAEKSSQGVSVGSLLRTISLATLLTPVSGHFRGSRSEPNFSSNNFENLDDVLDPVSGHLRGSQSRLISLDSNNAFKTRGGDIPRAPRVPSAAPTPKATTITPIYSPTEKTTNQPIASTTNNPSTTQPSHELTSVPVTLDPTPQPTEQPIAVSPSPTVKQTPQPTDSITNNPSTTQPSHELTSVPVTSNLSSQPTGQPSFQPSQPSTQPTSEPSSQTTEQPSSTPTTTSAPSIKFTEAVSDNTFSGEVVATSAVFVTETSTAIAAGTTTQVTGVANAGLAGLNEAALINSGITSLTQLTLLSAGLTTLTGALAGATIGGIMDGAYADKASTRRLTTTGEISSTGTDSNPDTKKSYAAAGTEIGALAGFAANVFSSVARYGFTPESHIAPLVALILTQNNGVFEDINEYKGAVLTKKINNSLEQVSHFNSLSSSAEKLKLGEALAFAFEHIMAPQDRGRHDETSVKDFIKQLKTRETPLNNLRDNFKKIFEGRGTKFSNNFFAAQGQGTNKDSSTYLKESPAILAQAIENCLKLQDKHVIPLAAYSPERNLLVNAHDLIDHYHDKSDNSSAKQEDLNPRTSLFSGYQRRVQKLAEGIITKNNKVSTGKDGSQL